MNLKTYLYILLFLVFGLLLLFGTGCILKTQIESLDIRIKKNQLLNYEFSSELLKLRFQEDLMNSDDVVTEVNGIIMESSVMNSSLDGLSNQFGWKEKFGESLINSIHSLVFKPLINVTDDNRYLFGLQKAFYLERNQNCNLAVPIYTDLEIKLRKMSNEDHAFSLLHLGYCLARIGKEEIAIQKLQNLISRYTNTHFAESAQVILNVLTTNIKRSEKLSGKSFNNRNLAMLYYQTGTFKKALHYFDNIEDITDEEKYYKARSNEKIGKIKEATDLYFDLLKSKEVNLAKKVNRRLLVIGNFYNGGETLKKIARENADKMGDTEMVDYVEKSLLKQTKSFVAEKLLEEKDAIITSVALDDDYLSKKKIELRLDGVDNDSESKENQKKKTTLLNKKIKEKQKAIEKKEEKVTMNLAGKRRENDEISSSSVISDQSGNIKISENKKIETSDSPDCLQFKSGRGILQKAEKVLVTDGHFVTIYKGKTVATPQSEFELLESCKINSPFTVSTAENGKFTVKKAIIRAGYLILETESGNKNININEIQSMIPLSIFEEIRFIIIKRKDGNFHYCNNINFSNFPNVVLYSKSGVSLQKNISDLDYIQLGENSKKILLLKKDKSVVATEKKIYIEGNRFEVEDLDGKESEILFDSIQRIDVE